VPQPKLGSQVQALHKPDTKRIGAIPTATGGITRLAYARAQAAGIKLEPLLEKARLTVRQIRDRTARISVQHQISFLTYVASSLQDEFLGFHLAQEADLRELGLLYYVPASSEFLGEALRRLARYSSMTNEGLALKYLEGRNSRLLFQYMGVARHSDRHQIEFCLTAVVRLCRQLTGRHLVPSRIRLAHPRGGDPSEMSAFFGGDLKFGAAVDEVAIDGTIKHMALLSADPYLNQLLIAICEAALSNRPTSRFAFRTAVENTIVKLLPHRRAVVGEVAERLGLSKRTLARRLTAEGLTFSGILKDLRADLVQQYLADPGLSISQIAWLLGYQESSAFTHAYKHQTGKTPREERLRHGYFAQRD
jgi:AraC-like DNA-binding protein